MRFLVAAAVVLFCVSCERKPTEEELERQREIQRANATPTPRPPLVNERMKGYKSPLESRPN